MQRAEYAARVAQVRQRAHGRWDQILAAAGVDERILRHRNGPCPSCGGTDRFQYTDKFGEGNYHCRHCGAGGGFKLLQAAKGIDFETSLKEVERCLGVLPEGPAGCGPGPDRMHALVQRIWSEAQPVTPGDEVDRYLRGRGLGMPAYPAALRFHPCLGYYERNGNGRPARVADHPAMLACIQRPDGQAVTLHRTYLQGGRKLPAADAKKVLSGGIQGAAVRLFEPGESLAVCEGIETALAIHLATARPVWSALSAGNLEKLHLPETVREVAIYADNDADGEFAGQHFAYALARRLRRDGPGGARRVRVFVPRHAGTDWADVWCQRQGLPGSGAGQAPADLCTQVPR